MKYKWLYRLRSVRCLRNIYNWILKHRYDPFIWDWNKVNLFDNALNQDHAQFRLIGYENGLGLKRILKMVISRYKDVKI